MYQGGSEMNWLILAAILAVGQQACPANCPCHAVPADATVTAVAAVTAVATVQAPPEALTGYALAYKRADGGKKKPLLVIVGFEGGAPCKQLHRSEERRVG